MSKSDGDDGSFAGTAPAATRAFAGALDAVAVGGAAAEEGRQVPETEEAGGEGESGERRGAGTLGRLQEPRSEEGLLGQGCRNEHVDGASCVG